MNEPRFVFHERQRAREDSDTRFEYRIWPHRPHPAVSILHGSWSLTGAERRSDIYLVSPISHRVLVKLRQGERLEIKHRLRDTGTVQSWRMQVSRRFPLRATDRQALTAALCLPGGLSRDALLSPAHLIAGLAARAEHVVPQTVRKSRLLFGTGAARAELCRVGVGDWIGLSIALEGQDLSSVQSARDTLRLGGLPNRSYGDALMQLVGSRTDRRRAPAIIESK